MAFFQERIRTNRDLVTDRAADVVTAGTLNDVPTANLMYLRLTLATTVSSFANPLSGKHLVVTNANTVNCTVVNNAGGTATNRILTGTGADAILAPGASMFLIYDDAVSLWRCTGVSFSAAVTTGFTVTDQLALTAGAQITPAAVAFQAFRVQGNAGAVSLSTTPFTTSAPGFGTGAVIMLIGNSNTNTVTVTFSDISKGFTGRTSVTLGKFDTLLLEYNAALDRYVEQARNIVNFAEQFPVGVTGAGGVKVALPSGASLFGDGGVAVSQYVASAVVRTSSTTTSIQFASPPFNTGVNRNGCGSFYWFDGTNTVNAGFFIGSNASAAGYQIILINGNGATSLNVANNGGTIQINVVHTVEASTNRFGSAFMLLNNT